MDHQNNYIGRSNWLLECKNLYHQYLSVLHNYFNLTKIFSNLYLAKFLDTSAKPRSTYD